MYKHAQPQQVGSASKKGQVYADSARRPLLFNVDTHVGITVGVGSQVGVGEQGSGWGGEFRVGVGRRSQVKMEGSGSMKIRTTTHDSMKLPQLKGG